MLRMSADPDILVTLTTARTEFEGATFVAVLRDAGIPAHVFAAAANMAQWEIGYTDPIKIQVRRADAARAAEVLRKNRQDSVDLDWSEVDVGRMEAGAPPVMPGAMGFWERRAVRARVRRIGLTLLAAAFVIGMLRGQAAAVIAVGIVTALIIWAYWDGDPAKKAAARHAGRAW